MSLWRMSWRPTKGPQVVVATFLKLGFKWKLWPNFFFFSGLKSDPDSYDSNDYNYDTANAEADYVEEPQPSLLPSFTTEAQHFKGRIL